jgi:hypothetical protein
MLRTGGYITRLACPPTVIAIEGRGVLVTLSITAWSGSALIWPTPTILLLHSLLLSLQPHGSDVLVFAYSVCGRERSCVHA